MLTTYLQAALLGIVEGLTEFLPVSSTGHLILLVDLLGFQGPPGKVFEIAIQLGAILAVCVVYWPRFFGTLIGLGRDEKANRFTVNVLLGFLPAMVIGFFAYGFIKGVLFSPWVVSVALVLGGVAILWIERVIGQGAVETVDQFKFSLSLKIGLLQCLAMIPGVSRSGASIIGARLLGVQRAAAAEFSFFLAVPTMVAATTYDLYKNWSSLSADGLGLIAVGLIVSFICAALVVRGAIAFINRYGFTPFAWYRIVIGCAMLVLLSLR
ncbi:undecaprenyl-diphosphate phosphatase [uncultured Ferrovibrio sp.]|mgnify:CR=1 FL=1|jgi:undecaprenyl-diphosphatase|uniref:undecaprenyl-diphosphate phosphatase n=1 Tax=uncultured Ferrovibrio sp. TaxID=1576913 RepID=UPI0026162DB9|nr:undecaprenyl-diphosphate phosphatase [uncultured Ferrovibrio sp.]